MGQMIGYDGEFAILSGVPTSTNQNAWVDFMKVRLKDPKYAKMKLVQVAYGQESEQVNQQQALALVQAFPNLKGIIIPAGNGSARRRARFGAGGIPWKSETDRAGSGDAHQEIHRERRCSGYLVERQNLGYLTYYGAQAYAQCKLTGKEGETFKAGRLGDYKVGAHGEVVLGPAQIVTPQNVEDFKF